MLPPESLEPEDLLSRNLVEIAPRPTPQRANDLSCGHWHELLLLQKLSQDAFTEKLMLCGCIKIRAELGECSDFSVLSQLQLQSSSNTDNPTFTAGRIPL